MEYPFGHYLGQRVGRGVGQSIGQSIGHIVGQRVGNEVINGVSISDPRTLHAAIRSVLITILKCFSTF